MIKLLAMVYFLAPIVALGSLVALAIVSDMDKRTKAARRLREQRQREHAEDCFRAGANIRFERFKCKFEQWKPSKIETALYAGAKLIDEMRAQ